MNVVDCLAIAPYYLTLFFFPDPEIQAKFFFNTGKNDNFTSIENFMIVFIWTRKQLFIIIQKNDIE